MKVSSLHKNLTTRAMAKTEIEAKIFMYQLFQRLCRYVKFFGNVLSNVSFMQFEWYTFEHYVLLVGSLEYVLVNATMQKAYFLYGKCVQVNNFEIVVNFFDTSRNLTRYSAIVHKFTRIYPVCSTYELTKQFV